jgi:hypothetical protein
MTDQPTRTGSYAAMTIRSIIGRNWICHRSRRDGGQIIRMGSDFSIISINAVNMAQAAAIRPLAQSPHSSLLLLVRSKLVDKLFGALVSHMNRVIYFAAVPECRQHSLSHHFVNLVLFPHRRLAKK